MVQSVFQIMLYGLRRWSEKSSRTLHMLLQYINTNFYNTFFPNAGTFSWWLAEKTECCPVVALALLHAMLLFSATHCEMLSS